MSENLNTADAISAEVEEQTQDIDSPAEKNPFEGIDPTLYDENGLKTDETIQWLKNMGEVSAKKDKQILDLRRVISKGVKVPDSPEEYMDGYKPMKDFESYYTSDGAVGQFVTDAMKRISAVSFEKGMTKDQSAAVRDLFNEMMVSVQLFDDKSEEAVLRRQNHREQVLGRDADALITANKKMFANHNGFDDAEKQALAHALDTNPVLAGALNKMRQLAFGSYGSMPARDYVSSGILPDDRTLAREYADPATSDKRREEILTDRIKAGRTGSLDF